MNCPMLRSRPIVAAPCFVALCLAALALSLGCAPDDRATTWRFAIEETRGSVQDAYAQAFAEAIADRTDGRITVKVYPYGTLGTSDQITELLHNGTLQFATASPGHLGKIIPEVQAFLLHYSLHDDEAINSAALGDPDLRRWFDALYAEKGFRLLDFFSEGLMAWTTRGPVRRPEDFAGLKMRVMTSPLLLAAYEAYGASPTPLPYAEVYSALQLNMIDAQVNPVFAIEEMSFYEVTDHLILPGHAHFVTSVMTHRGWYDGLPEADRAMLESVLRDLHGDIYEIQREFNQARLARILERKPDLVVLTLDPDERAAFRALAEPVHRVFVELAGPRAQAALDALSAAVARAEAREEKPDERRARPPDGMPAPDQ